VQGLVNRGPSSDSGGIFQDALFASANHAFSGCSESECSSQKERNFGRAMIRTLQYSMLPTWEQMQNAMKSIRRAIIEKYFDTTDMVIAPSLELFGLVPYSLGPASHKIPI
jgi:hypothetical protein